MTHQYIEVPGGDHGSVLTTGAADIFAFFNAKFQIALAIHFLLSSSDQRKECESIFHLESPHRPHELPMKYPLP